MVVGGHPNSPAASTPGKDPVPYVQEAGWAPGPAWTGGKSRPRRDSIPNRPTGSQSLYRQSYTVYATVMMCKKNSYRKYVAEVYGQSCS